MKIPVHKFKDGIYLVTLYDIHYGSPTFKWKEFNYTLDFIRENENARFILGGDMIENITPNGKPIVTDQSINPTEQVEEFLSVMSPYKDKCLGIIQGNHEKRTKKRSLMDITKVMAMAMGCSYLGIGGYIKLIVGKIEYVLATHHGVSATKNWQLELDKMSNIYRSADVVIAGHDHNCNYDYIVYEELIDNKMKEGYKTYVRGGNYLGYAEYAREKSYAPKPTGSIIICLHPGVKKVQCERLMYINGELI
jgi:predicted phosphodiesterase